MKEQMFLSTALVGDYVNYEYDPEYYNYYYNDYDPKDYNDLDPKHVHQLQPEDGKAFHIVYIFIKILF